MTPNQAIKKLNKIKKDPYTTDLTKAVIDILNSNLKSGGYDKAESYFDDLSHGCESGIVGELIYYSDTHPFAQKHLEDIMNLLADTGEELGEPIKIPTDTDSVNWLAWFGFEQTAYNLQNQLNIEL